MSELQPIGEILDNFGQPKRRHAVARRGRRAEIPQHVRAAVWFRDCDAPALTRYPL